MTGDIIALVLCALLQIESSGGTDLRHGDGGLAVGPYQMHTEAVDEANRIEQLYSRKFGREARRWVYMDRKDPNKSRDMCELTMIWHYRRGVTDPVELACRWHLPHGGPNPRYYRKAKKIINQLTTRNK